MKVKKRRRLKKWAKVTIVILAVILASSGFAAYKYITRDVIEMGGIANQGREEYKKEEQPQEEGSIEYTVFDLGAGQSIYIDAGDIEILIDGGKDEADAKKIIEHISGSVNGKLDYVIATNNNEDRIGGLPYIYDAVKVDKTLYEGESQSKAFNALKSAAEKGGSFEVASRGTIDLKNNNTITVLRPVTGNKDTGKNSIVTYTLLGGFSFVETGDLDEEGETALRYDISDIGIADVAVLVAGNHGRAGSNTLFDVLGPKNFVISGDKADVPQETLTGASDYTNYIYATYKSGNITYVITKEEGLVQKFDGETVI